MEDAHPAPSKLHEFMRYAFGAALVGIALFISLILQVPFGNPFWFFFLCRGDFEHVWYGGRGPGWVAVGFSTLTVLYFFIPPVRTWILKPSEVPFFLTFVSCQVAASLLSSWRRQTEDSLRHARDDLELKVEERTAELKNANEALLNQIAEQRRTEESLEITRTELARVVRITTIGELTASIAHEVNQPLAAVVSNADACVAWLSHQNPNLGEARAAAERTVHGATRASEVIVQIRSLINKTTPERKRVHINEIIEDTVTLIHLQATRNDVSVATELAPDLPVVFGDKIQLQQVILNLTMNGIEAMTAVSDRPRQLLIRSRMQDGSQVLVSIQDSGVGLSAEVMARLFEPFFTTRSKGIGMGLPISRSIIEAHGGRLWAESAVSQGSVFQLTLPAAGGPPR